RTKVLLLEHKQLKMRLQPGGHLSGDDESPFAGATRVVQRVTGQMSMHHLSYHGNPMVPLDIDTHPIPADQKQREEKHWHHDFRYLFIANSEEVQMDDPEYRDPGWVRIEELERYHTFSTAAIKIKQIVSREFRIKFFYDEV